MRSGSSPMIDFTYQDFTDYNPIIKSFFFSSSIPNPWPEKLWFFNE